MKAIYGAALLGLTTFFVASTCMAASGLRITCDGDNLNAEVFINDKFKGECPLDMQLKEGQYKLRIQKVDDEHEPRVFEQVVRLGDGVLKKIEVQLGAPQIKTIKDCPDCPDMLVIPAGSFDMGLNGQNADEKPQHRVSVKAFALGKTEITKGQFAAFVNATNYDAGNECWVLEGDKFNKVSGKDWRNPGYNQTDNHPVTCINWNDAKAYTSWLSHTTGKTYQLPSEAQWEYACRAGQQTEYCGSDNMDSIAWYGRKNGDTTQPVAQKQANAFGLYDMSGNVWEWVEDSYHDTYNGAPTDGTEWQGDGAKRVLRGGSWSSKPQNTRAASRGWGGPAERFNYFGFRLARMLP